MTDFAAPKGMRDFYPEDYRAREALFEAWRATAARWGFEMFDAPVVETLELLERKAGEEISEQIYAFEDKSGNRLALRPELTPSLARMIIARQGALTFPLKWSAVAQCFRYERMQRGRKREHYQWNLDIVGEPSVMAEAEVIGAAVAVLARLGLTSEEFKVRVGSRTLLASILQSSGLNQEHFTACYLALDKRGKVSDREVAELLEKEGLAKEDIDFVFKLFSVKSLDDVLKDFPDTPEVNGAATDIYELLKMCAKLGFDDALAFDLGVIRGLGYYTGIVFEAFDTAGKFRAIFGGGRYDSLLSALGGERMPSVGLGFGDVVVMELLADLGKMPQTQRAVEYAVGFMDEASRGLALEVAARLRRLGRDCDLGLRPERPKKFFDRANRQGAARAIYIGPDEAAKGQFSIKTMATSETATCTLDALGAPIS